MRPGSETVRQMNIVKSYISEPQRGTAVWWNNLLLLELEA